MTVTSARPDRQGESAAEPLLSVRDLRVTFGTPRGPAHVVNGLSYDVHAGETLAIVGESGSGKSQGVLALLGLVPQPPGRVEGEAHFEGRDLLRLPKDDIRRVRGPGVAMVFQDPMSSLNPVLSIGRQLTEGMETHLGLTRGQARDRAADLLGRVGLPDPRSRLDAYPHQLSGGMRQRVMIAMALACEPRVLVADEATTALDVTVQAQIVELLTGLQDELGMAMLWISHDLGVVAGVADRVLVMYAGRVLEEAPVDALYADPRHPYTRGLLASLPTLGTDGDAGVPEDLTAIPGLPPDPVNPPPGCPFHPRCAYRWDERCATEVPPLREVGPPGAGHRAATFYDVREGS
jgi:oligopeptide/dipeptide ABC transporter ATP-binding protein